MLELQSSPARGTWIEIQLVLAGNTALHQVVPRKGDVDRNLRQPLPHIYRNVSSPARGTWIEIPPDKKSIQKTHVVPRKGDVDRNMLESDSS